MLVPAPDLEVINRVTPPASRLQSSLPMENRHQLRNCPSQLSWYIASLWDIEASRLETNRKPNIIGLTIALRREEHMDIKNFAEET